MIFFFFKQKTAYEMRISDWSSDVCSSDLLGDPGHADAADADEMDGPDIAANAFHRSSILEGAGFDVPADARIAKLFHQIGKPVCRIGPADRSRPSGAVGERLRLHPHPQHRLGAFPWVDEILPDHPPTPP